EWLRPSSPASRARCRPGREREPASSRGHRVRDALDRADFRRGERAGQTRSGGDLAPARRDLLVEREVLVRDPVPIETLGEGGDRRPQTLEEGGIAKEPSDTFGKLGVILAREEKPVLAIPNELGVPPHRRGDDRKARRETFEDHVRERLGSRRAHEEARRSIERCLALALHVPEETNTIGDLELAREGLERKPLATVSRDDEVVLPRVAARPRSQEDIEPLSSAEVSDSEDIGTRSVEGRRRAELLERDAVVDHADALPVDAEIPNDAREERS